MLAAWQQALDEVRQQVPTHAYDTYLKDLVPDGCDDAGRFVVRVPDRFTADRVERTFGDRLAREMGRQIGQSVELRFLADRSLPRCEPDCSTEDSGPQAATPAVAPVDRPLRFPANPKYTFENFVVGPCNQVAQGAALAVADGDTRLFNPFFLYGDTGLGKSHLASAIGHYIHRNRPESQVLYLSAERFVNEMVQALRSNYIQSFKDRYRRRCDVLILDDVQFVGGKTRTQGELFHTLDALYATGKQVVMVSDSPPKEIPGIEEGLRSRFGCGLVVDVRAPGYETRRAILLHRVQVEGLDVPDAVLDHIARNVRSNVRDLEGSLLRVVSVASFGNRPLTVELAQEALRELVQSDDPVSIPAIIALVARYFQVTPEQINSRSRRRTAVLPRQIAIYLSRRFCDVSLAEIGRAFNRDHSTVLHSISTIEKKMQAKASLQRQVEFLAAKIELPD